MIFGGILWTIENLFRPFDRAHQVVLEPVLERLEHVAGQITSGITSEISDFGQFLAFFRGLI